MGSNVAVVGWNGDEMVLEWGKTFDSWARSIDSWHSTVHLLTTFSIGVTIIFLGILRKLLNFGIQRHPDFETQGVLDSIQVHFMVKCERLNWSHGAKLPINQKLGLPWHQSESHVNHEDFEFLVTKSWPKIPRNWLKSGRTCGRKIDHDMVRNKILTV